MSEIYERLATAVLNGESEKSPQLVQRALNKNLPPNEILEKSLVVGMAEVGVRFKRGDMFVPEVLMCAEAMARGLDVLRPHLAETGIKLAGRILMGTVKGDLHDIGKNLVSMMCEGAGFEIVDLGFDVSPDRFVEGIKEYKPDIVGMSAMLTTTMRSMAHTIKAIEEAGLRDRVKIICGGAPLDAAFTERIGADGYGSNAPSGAELAQELLGIR